MAPFLEESLPDGEAKWDEPFWSATHRAYVGRSLPVFLCPTVAGQRGPFEVVDKSEVPLRSDGRTIELGRSHYVASHGQEECWADCSGPNGGFDGDVSRIADGPFYRNSHTATKDVRDGLSQTIFLGEHTARLSDKTWVGVVPGAFVHPRIESPQNSAETAATLVLVHSGPAAGERDPLGNPIIHPPNFPTLHVGQMQSDHYGGANVAMGDGSVRWIAEDIQLASFAAMMSIAEKELLP